MEMPSPSTNLQNLTFVNFAVTIFEFSINQLASGDVQVAFSVEVTDIAGVPVPCEAFED
jgi:hypothetical protein